ncbi:MAG: hypothetical protein RMY34_07005 [Aulosira sp. DedQUE10]|nr:hypothetical protein [Aulosira sp. DedQUE10]
MIHACWRTCYIPAFILQFRQAIAREGLSIGMELFPFSGSYWGCGTSRELLTAPLHSQFLCFSTLTLKIF